MGVEWKAAMIISTFMKVATVKPGSIKWTGTRFDLVFGANSELGALAEVYGCSDAEDKFV